jgi:hypothetical protein
MKGTDLARFKETMTRLAKVYDRELDAVVLDAYWTALSDWAIEDFETAALHLMRSSVHMPRPADFNALRKASRPTAAEAWARVLQHCKGAYRDGGGLDGGGPIDDAVAGLGGYKAIAHYNIDYLGALQRQFVDRYGEQSDAHETRESVPQITAESRGLLQ